MIGEHSKRKNKMGLEIIQPLINKFGLILQQGVEVAREVTPSSAQTTAITGSL